MIDITSVLFHELTIRNILRPPFGLVDDRLHTNPNQMGAEMILKRRGNPTWGSRVLVPAPHIVTEFERVVARLRLKPDEYVESAKLREWAEVNKDARYVPERLLKAWGIPLRRNIEDFI